MTAATNSDQVEEFFFSDPVSGPWFGVLWIAGVMDLGCFVFETSLAKSVCPTENKPPFFLPVRCLQIAVIGFPPTTPLFGAHSTYLSDLASLENFARAEYNRPNSHFLSACSTQYLTRVGKWTSKIHVEPQFSSNFFFTGFTCSTTISPSDFGFLEVRLEWLSDRTLLFPGGDARLILPALFQPQCFGETP